MGCGRSWLCAGLVLVLSTTLRATNDPNKPERERFSSAVAYELSAMDAEFMKKYNYPCQTVDEILEAFKSDNSLIRGIAIKMLTQKIGEKAKPTLLKALSDPEVTVRLRGAELLGYLGDPSGVPQLRKDFAEWTQRYEKGITDGNHPPSDSRVMWRRRATPDEAVQIGYALARFGDNRGFQIASQVVLEYPVAFPRYLALGVLIEIDKNNRSGPVPESQDPGPVFLVVAQSEGNTTVLQRLVTAAHSMRPDVRTQIWNAIMVSSRAPDKIREEVDRLRQKAEPK